MTVVDAPGRSAPDRIQEPSPWWLWLGLTLTAGGVALLVLAWATTA